MLTSPLPVWHWGLSAERIERFGSLRDDLERAHDRQLPALCLRLLGLAGESLVESHRLSPFADSLLRLKRQQDFVIVAAGQDRFDQGGIGGK